MSKNIHLTMKEELHARFDAIVQRYRLKNVQEAIVGLVGLFCKHVEVNEDARKQRRVAAPVSIEDEIDDLFRELDEVHITPENTAPLKIHRPRKSAIDKPSKKASPAPEIDFGTKEDEGK